jgi:hypothetical protein
MDKQQTSLCMQSGAQMHSRLHTIQRVAPLLLQDQSIQQQVLLLRRLPLQERVTHLRVGLQQMAEPRSPSHMHMVKLQTSLCMQSGQQMHLRLHTIQRAALLLLQDRLIQPQVLLLRQPPLQERVTRLRGGLQQMVELRSLSLMHMGKLPISLYTPYGQSSEHLFISMQMITPLQVQRGRSELPMLPAQLQLAE